MNESPVLARKALTLHRLREMHASGEKIAMLTCYDASFARLLDGADAAVQWVETRTQDHDRRFVLLDVLADRVLARFAARLHVPGVGDDDLLLTPDHAPDVQEHDERQKDARGDAHRCDR